MAGKYKLKGVGCFTANMIPTDDKHKKERDAMWNAMNSWDSGVEEEDGLDLEKIIKEKF